MTEEERLQTLQNGISHLTGRIIILQHMVTRLCLNTMDPQDALAQIRKIPPPAFDPPDLHLETGYNLAIDGMIATIRRHMDSDPTGDNPSDA